MKFTRRNLLWCLLTVSLLVLVGCDGGTEEGTSPNTPPPAPAAAAPAPTAPAAVAPSATAPAADSTAPALAAAGQPASVDLEKPLAEVQAEAKTMSVENLKATALKYKEAIFDKETQLGKLAAKVKDIPIAQALGGEGKTLKTDLANLQTSLTALKERFQVYYNALKEKGGDLSGLTQ